MASGALYAYGLDIGLQVRQKLTGKIQVYGISAHSLHFCISCCLVWRILEEYISLLYVVLYFQPLCSAQSAAACMPRAPLSNPQQPVTLSSNLPHAPVTLTSHNRRAIPRALPLGPRKPKKVKLKYPLKCSICLIKWHLLTRQCTTEHFETTCLLCQVMCMLL